MLENITNILLKPDDPQILPLTGAPLALIIISVGYCAFVYKIGPKFMANREPFNLKQVILFYNIAQIATNLFMAYLFYYLAFVESAYDLGCINQLPDDHPLRPTEIAVTYLYYLNKFMDYMDTIFFVLRKSYKQITFLHVYHHVMMTTSHYFFIRSYGFGGHVSAVSALNSVVHVVMYSYYTFSIWYPGSKASLWWKKYITIMQLLQFIIVFFHNIYPLLLRTDCTYPKFWNCFCVVQSIIMIKLFGDFYVNAYLKKKPRAARRKQQ